MTTEHIKIPDVKPVIRYLADGVTSQYTYPFPIFASEDIKITLDAAPQTQGFTIQGAGETNGGTVTFDTPPDNGTTIVIERRLPLERIVTLPYKVPSQIIPTRRLRKVLHTMIRV